MFFIIKHKLEECREMWSSNCKHSPKHGSNEVKHRIMCFLKFLPTSVYIFPLDHMMKHASWLFDSTFTKKSLAPDVLPYSTENYFVYLNLMFS